MISIKNQYLTAGFDDNGRIICLENNDSGYGNIIDYPAAGIFKMVLKRGDNWENIVYPRDQLYEVKKEANQVVITVKKVAVRGKTFDVTLIMRIWLEQEKLCFTADIDNRSDTTVVDFMFPCIGVIRSLAGGKPNLLWPHSAGQLITDIGGRLSSMDSPYEEYNMISLDYPFFASMQWMGLTDGSQSLYFGSHDSEFYASALRVIGRQEDPGSIIMDMVKYTFVKPGEYWQGQPFVVSLYTGSWRLGADIYRAWADSWLPRPDKPEWVRDMLGYFLVINKQQYGDILWPYDTLPELWDYARQHGCDTLGLFGWTRGGHDNLYPEVEADTLMGGEDKLRDRIAEVQDAGGHVTLYCNGHLMDVGTDYYKQTGHSIESKSLWGTPYYEQYNKYHESEFMKKYTRKTFSTACPSAPQWQDRMCENARTIYKYSPDGVLMDQIGGIWPYPCFDESHPHVLNKPSLSMTRGRISLLNSVYKQTKELNPMYGYIVECITDLYSTHADAIHGLTNCHPGETGDRAALNLGKTKGSRVLPFAEMYRYTLPEVIMTVRNPKPYINPRMANFAFVFGFRYEMELRYLGDAKAIREDRYKAWREYAARVAGLRRQYWHILGLGQYVDEEGFENGNRVVTAKAFISENHMAVALWNDTDKDERADIGAPGYRFAGAADLEGTKEDIPQIIKSQQIAVLFYEKN
ncbi:MAG: DUF6259 domain-containing protein [Eubacteriales bacterium]|nr:DUF6259 domain-containing protein [Eubacteriales bacterium]